MTLQGSGKFEITQSKYRLSEEQKNGDGQKLFDFCAECLKTFVETNIGSDDDGPIKDGKHLPLGFTVSFIFIFNCCGIRRVTSRCCQLATVSFSVGLTSFVS